MNGLNDVSQIIHPISKPIVFLLDFDGTLVGDVEWLANEYTLFQNYNSGQVSKVVKYQPAYLMQDLGQHMIRPYLKEFLLATKLKYPQIEFFIYTASDTEWAEFIIPRVEQKLGFKFNRPLFTRTHCICKNGSYIKSLDTVRGIVYKRLAKQYKLKTMNDIQSMILVDNTPHVLTDNRAQVLCPTYDYQLPVDLTRQIPVSMLETFLPWLRPMIAPTKRFKTLQHFWYYFHRFMSELYLKACKMNKYYLKDFYWKKMHDACSETDLSKFNTYELKAYLSSRT